MYPNSSNSYIKNADLRSGPTKNRILSYLYNHVKLNSEHESIVSEKQLNSIKNSDYIICPRFSGIRSWILFFHIDHYYYAVNFPKHNQKKKKT